MKTTAPPDQFSALRKLAKEKRDRDIVAARSDYEAALLRIAAIERSLLPRARRRRDSIGACVDPLIPQDRPFTIPQLMDGLEAINGHHGWRKKSVTVYVGRLRRRGIIRRIRRAGGSLPAVFAMAGVIVDQEPLADMTLAEAIRQVMVRPMNVTEIAVALLEAGYQTGSGNRAFRGMVAAAMREAKGGFQRTDAGKWKREAS